MISQHPLHQGELPVVWRRFLFIMAIVKAGVAGATAGIALLGMLDIAAAASAKEWITDVQRSHLLDAFAGAGGVVGAAFKIFAR